MSKITKQFHWSPWSTILQQGRIAPYGIIILNRPINFTFESNQVLSIWNQAKLRITVDGGTDMWLQFLKTHKFESQVAHPDLITGDMDSVSKSTLNYYKEHTNTSIIYTEDQNQTDFTKALKEAMKFCLNQNIELESIFVFCEISGRFDQLLSNINTLFKKENIIGDCKLYILCPDSVTWLLPEGFHSIKIPYKIMESKEWCSLLPIGAPCQVSTTGLKWNLNKSIMEFGGMVSSSNTYSGEEVVTVQTDSPIVWSMGIENLFE